MKGRFYAGDTMIIFNELINELYKYEKLLKDFPKDATPEDEYKLTCAELDIAKGFVYDLGYERSQKFANAILTLGKLGNLD